MASRAPPSLGETHHRSEMKIVLIGGRQMWDIEASGKSSIGNTILGRDIFETGRRTAQCVSGQRYVYGRQITLIDTPGWWWGYPVDNTPKLDQLEIMRSVYLCHPGPQAFLLVIPVDTVFPNIFKRSLQEHLELFNDRVWRHTIVLFSTITPPNDRSLQKHISDWPDLQWLIKKCGNRYHVLNVNNRGDDTQVTELLEKIEEMVAGNDGNHYETNQALSEELEEKRLAVIEVAKRMMAKVQRQRTRLRALIKGEATSPTYLRLVIVGAQWAARSSAGNTILGEGVFDVADNTRRTVHCVTRHGEVAGRQLTVVDTPGWHYNSSLQNTSKMDRFEIVHSVFQCPPGPHAVLLVVPFATAFNKSYERAVEEHMGLLTDAVWKHTIVLFTRGDWLGDTTVEQRIASEGKGLQWLIEKCGNRYHVFDNKNRSDATQVIELLEKVEEMVAENRGCPYEIDTDVSADLEQKKRAGKERAQKITMKVQRQMTTLRELFKGEEQIFSEDELRIVLVGRREAGKSVAGNTILVGELFPTAMTKEFRIQNRTTRCVMHQKRVAGMKLKVVDTPGWWKRTPQDARDKVQDEVVRSVSLCPPGPHAFLLVIPISAPFSEGDLKAVEEHLGLLTEKVWRHTMVLFTWGDWLGDRAIEEYIEREGEALQQLVEKCGNRYHVMNCHGWDDGSQVTTLLRKVKEMVVRNKGHNFTIEQKSRQKPMLHWLAGKGMMTEEEWNRREEELIERMLKAVVVEPEESKLPFVRGKESIDFFIPSMSCETPSEVGSSYINYGAHAKVSEWRVKYAGRSAASSGHGTMSSAVSYMGESLDRWENLVKESLGDGKIRARMLDSPAKSEAHTYGVKTKRRNSH
ncbi:GTPase IMAP family member 8 [Oncorhynchus mykiss]|uniref:GTPase IMAP family member 8 n=1 Tax=Oncorhynchus mykiss TaxID=8022 RepID=UPI0018781FF1|nr:GTPase IMAP family member 8 [Oncorhynchus mykiss]XP_036793411.1 GTPase IMAP family member 8 [Oncorhynchus mykiss]